VRALRGFGVAQAERVVLSFRRTVTAAAPQQAADVDQHGVGHRQRRRHDAALEPEQLAVRPAQDAVAAARVLERLRGAGVVRCLPLSCKNIEVRRQMLSQPLWAQNTRVQDCLVCHMRASDCRCPATVI